MYVLVLIALCGVPAFGCYSGLTIIPTADIIGENQYSLDYQIDGEFPVRDEDTRILNTEIGVGQNAEIGLDFDLSHDAETSVLANIKYLITAGNEQRPALAVGVCNLGRNLRSSQYLVATQDFKLLRGHLGAIRVDGDNHWFLGVDRSVTERLILMADYTCCGENFSSVGAGYQFNHHFGIMIGAQFPNNDDDEVRFTLHMILNGFYNDLEKGK